MGFNVSLRIESWVEIQGHVGVGLVVLKVDGEDIEQNVNHKQKVFVWMKHGCFIGSVSIEEFLLEIFQMDDHSFGFIEDRRNEEL